MKYDCTVGNHLPVREIDAKNGVTHIYCQNCAITLSPDESISDSDKEYIKDLSVTDTPTDPLDMRGCFVVMVASLILWAGIAIIIVKVLGL